MFDTTTNHTDASMGFGKNELPPELGIFADDQSAEVGEFDQHEGEPDDNDTPAFLTALNDVKSEPAPEYEDGQMIYVPASMLLDMKHGNLFKRKSSTAELKADIAANGINSSVTARPHPTQAGFLELLAGYGRRDIAKELDIEVPVIVRLVDDRTALLIHRGENMLRSGHSFGDEVRITREWLSLFAGDRATAQSKSGWSVSKFNERVEMLKATDEVLEALDEGRITVKHAVILASFEANVQNNTLKKVIDERWSVAELKQRADKVTVPLSIAIFSKVDCEVCPHNTVRQRGLFDMESVEEGCVKGSCFKAKTDAELAVRKEAALERFGRIIMLSESVASDRVTVTAENVGAEQFNSGCAGCSDNVVLMNDTIGSKTGSLTPSQCINSSCFKECESKQKAAVQAEEKAKAKAAKKLKSKTDNATQQVAGNGDDTTEEAALEEKSEKTVVVGSYTTTALEAHQAELNAHAAKHLKNDAVFAEAMKAYALANVVGLTTQSRGKQLMAALMSKTVEELQALQQEAISYMLTKTKTVTMVPSWEFLAAAAKATETGEAAMVAAWKPETASMEKYTTIQLELLGNESGLFAADPEGAKKAKAGKKADLVKFIVDSKKSGFDWTSFAPAPYLSLLKK